MSNAAAGRDLGYYRGKEQVEDAVRAAEVRYAIVRPTLVVGPADVLTNNIAWFLRRFPFFPIPDGGGYRIQPVTLADVGRIIADRVDEDRVSELDAAGPEVFTFAEYVRVVRDACGVHRPLLPVPSWLTLAGLRMLEPLLGDVVLTREELRGLAQDLLISHAPALGRESVREWLTENGTSMGREYVNDMRRHFRDGAGDPVLDPTTMRPA